MNLTKTGPNEFEDRETNTRFSFLFNHELSLEEAERRAYALQRARTEYLLRTHFFGRHHAVPETGDLSDHPSFSS